MYFKIIYVRRAESIGATLLFMRIGRISPNLKRFVRQARYINMQETSGLADPLSSILTTSTYNIDYLLHTYLHYSLLALEMRDVAPKQVRRKAPDNFLFGRLFLLPAGCSGQTPPRLTPIRKAA